jgi:membrane associated rhomboid family serine protease
MSEKANPSKDQDTRDRVAAAVIGALFVGIAISIFVSFANDLSVGAALAGVVMGGLGAEALYSAARGRRCLLSRIGPLP